MGKQDWRELQQYRALGKPAELQATLERCADAFCKDCVLHRDITPEDPTNLKPGEALWCKWFETVTDPMAFCSTGGRRAV